MFGDGNLCHCNPIAETDLAAYMLDCITNQEQWNKVLNIGGPGDALTMRQQGELLFDVSCFTHIDRCIATFQANEQC